MKKNIVLLLLFCAGSLFAARPTVTVTKPARTETSKLKYYEFTYSTAIADLDTAYIYDENGLWFNADGIGYTDSTLTIELWSSETTADSVRHTVALFVNSDDASPALATAVLATSDATSFTNTLTGHVTFNIKAEIGLSKRFVIAILENDTNKDATQTITGRILIPKQ